MCGIAGRVGDSAGNRSVLKAMTDSILHRGPDEEGFFIEPGVELGSRRLAIIDIAGGQQPFSDAEGFVKVVFNGEIYNFQELRKILLDDGYKLRTHGDTEVIALLYLKEGINFLRHLRGMFAIALWDSRNRSLSLVRDRLGKKPLLYRLRDNGGLDFASEAKALLIAGAAREPDLLALDYVLNFGYAPPPMTGFKSIAALAPGHVLTWSDGRVEVKQYWKFDSSKKTIFDMREAIDETKEVLEDSVRLRLISERPIGVMLSGGIDSSIVAGYSARNLSTKLNTFTVGFEDPTYDESKYAEKVAAILDTNHHHLVVRPDPEELVRTLARTLDRPFADSSILPTFLVSEFAHSEVIVALGGDGGDETYGGYPRYQNVDRMQALNPLLTVGVPFGSILRTIALHRNSQSLYRLASGFRTYRNSQERYLALVSLVHANERQNLWANLPPTDSTRNAPAEWFKEMWSNASSREKLDRALAVDIQTYLPEDLNFKTDIASMANSLEIRSPFQDHKLVELSGRISEDLKFHRGQTKYILREIAKEFIPPEIVDRKKMGFGIPRARWMREQLRPLVAETLLGTSAWDRGWFDLKAVAQEIDLHNAGIDRDRILWPLLAIELWAQNWID